MVDFKGYNDSNKFVDYQQANQAFQLQKALQAQQLQGGAIDAASKANIYKTQLLSGAVAGGQGAYDQAKQTLQQQGIDTSEFAPDAQTAAQQLQQARLAQSPLGTLFNAAQKDQTNQLALAGLTGQITPGAIAPRIPQISAPGVPLPGGAADNAPVQYGNAPIQDATTAITAPASPQPVAPQATPVAQAPIAAQPQTTAVLPSVPKFSPPAQKPGETLAAYNARTQQAFEAYKSDPAYLSSQAAATETGKAQADAAKAAVGANANYDQVVQTVNGIKALNNSPAGLPQDRYGIPASWRAAANQNFGDQKLADNNNTFNKLNEAQTIGAIKELASTGQIRMTRTLENILNRGYLIEPGSSPTSKNQQADAILAELNNNRIATQNVNTGLSGGQAAPYQQIPTAATPSTPQPGTTMDGIDGTYLFNGGDPADKNNWKKVK